MVQHQERMYINVVKGIAVVLMIWGHCIQYCAKGAVSSFDNSVYQFIYSFHMPLFMLISGYLFWFSCEKRDLKTLLVHRTQGMLQPIVFGSILNIFMGELPALLLHGVLDIGNGKLLYGLYTLWFLWCVLSASTAVAVAEKTATNSWIRCLYIVLGILFVSLFPENHYHLYMYPYFVAGFYFAKHRERIPNWVSRCAIVSLLVFPVMVPLYESKHLIYFTPVFTPEVETNSLVRINLFRWAIGFAGSLFVLTLVGIGFRLFYGKKPANWILRGLAKLGENSLAIYCISVSLLSDYLALVFGKILQVTGRNIFAENVLVFNYLFTPVLTLLYCFGLYYAVLFMKKIRIHKLIFGR